MAARLAKEGEIPKSEHVERREERSHQAHEPEDQSVAALHESRIQNRVLREEARQREEAGNRKDRGSHRPECDGHVFAEPTHLAQVLLTAQSVNH